MQTAEEVNMWHSSCEEIQSDQVNNEYITSVRNNLRVQDGDATATDDGSKIPVLVHSVTCFDAFFFEPYQQ